MIPSLLDRWVLSLSSPFLSAVLWQFKLPLIWKILYYQKNGQGIWLQEEIVSIRNEQNIIVLFLVTFRDITPFKEPLEGQSVMSNLSKFARLAWTITRARPNNNLAPSRYVLVTVWTVNYVTSYRQQWSFLLWQHWQSSLYVSK